MEFTHIPNLKNSVSRIGLGTWAIGGWMWGGTDEKNAISTIHRALDSGINLIDTAPVYGFGTAEKIVGKALKQYGNRERIVIATKVGINWEDHQPFRDSRKVRIMKEIEDSLKRLQVDYIDLYQVHWPDPETPIAETAEALSQLVKEGKIRAIGVSNYSVEEMETFQKTTELHAAQPPFNLFERQAEQTILLYCKNKHLSTLGYGVLCRGLLSGKMRLNTQFQGDDLRKFDPKFQTPRYSQYLACVEQLDQWAQRHYQRSVLSLAVRWVLDKGINIALWGARKPEQLDAIASVWGWKLNSQDFKEIDDILNKMIPIPVGPEFMAPPLTSQLSSFQLRQIKNSTTN
jgi:aryl-alcohol dehydrogenase-like predicted oxidoreductase